MKNIQKLSQKLDSPALIMMCGLPCSGKSTWIKTFVENSTLDWTVISSDNIIDEMCEKEGVTYSEGFSRFVSAAGQEMNRRAKQAFAEGKNIIWDQTNLTVKSRRGKLKTAVEKSYDIGAVVFNVDPKIIKQRNIKRSEEIGKFIPEQVIANMESSFVAPTREEGFKTIVSVDFW